MKMAGLVLAGVLGLGTYVFAQDSEKVCLLRKYETKELHEYADRIISMTERRFSVTEKDKDKFRREITEKTLKRLEEHFYLVDRESDCPTRMHKKYNKIINPSFPPKFSWQF